MNTSLMNKFPVSVLNRFDEVCLLSIVPKPCAARSNPSVYIQISTGENALLFKTDEVPGINYFQIS